MRAVKIILVCLVAVVVVIAGALLYISNQDLSQYEFVEKTVEDFTGRDVTLGGEIRVKVWLTSTATATDVTLANAPWGSAPDMVKVGTLEAAFNPFALLWDEVRIKRFILKDTTVLLETDANGRGNWVFAEGEALEPATEPSGGFPFKIHVDGVRVENADVSFHDGTSGQTHRIDLDKLTATADALDAPMELSLAARYQDQPVELEGQAGPLLRFFSDRTMEIDLTAKALGVTATAKGKLEGIAGDQVQALDLSVSADSSAELAEALQLDLPELSDLNASGTISTKGATYSLKDLDASVGIGDGEVTAKGSVDDLVALTGIDLGIAIEAPKVSDFSGLAQAELPDAGPVKVSAQVKSVDQGYSVPDFSAELGDSKVTGEASVDMSKTPKQVRLRIEAETLNLDQFLPQAAPEAGSPADQASTETQKSSGKLFSSEPLPFEQLADLDVEGSIQAKRLIVNNIEIEDVSLPVTVKESKLSITPRARLADGTLNGELRVDGAATPPGAALKVELDDFLLGKLMAMVADSDLVSGGPGDFSLDLTSSGQSLSALMARSNGTLRLNSGKGQIANTLIDKVGVDIVTGMLSFLVPASEKGGVTQMECTRVATDIKDGIAAVNQLTLVSSKAVMRGTGAINLRDESYDMGVSVKARKGVSVSAGDLAGGVRITGPLSSPNVDVNPEGVAATAAFGTAAVMTGGLSFLAEKALEMAKSEDPCAASKDGASGTAVTQKAPGSEAASEQGTAAPAEQGEEKSANPIESIGESIKGIFEGN